jgi:hypothetical protein
MTKCVAHAFGVRVAGNFRGILWFHRLLCNFKLLSSDSQAINSVRSVGDLVISESPTILDRVVISHVEC